MKNSLTTIVEKLKKAKRVRRRVVSLIVALALVVSGGVYWELKSDGVAMANETYCGMEEHIHGEDCYESVLVCVLEENDAEGGHTHDASCYESVLVCEIPEHTHTVSCLTDETADVETAADWEATLPDDLSGVWADDVAATAQSQIGYAESEVNFQLDEDGVTRRGYTRYGAWYGNEYGSWDAMFASFCLYYAGVSEDLFPQGSGAYAWVTDLLEAQSDSAAFDNDAGKFYADAADYTPKAGDIVFFDKDADGVPDHVGIVEYIETEADSLRTDEIAGEIDVDADYLSAGEIVEGIDADTEPLIVDEIEEDAEADYLSSDEIVGLIDNDTDFESGDVIATALWIIEGDCDGAVCENKYVPDDETITTYGVLPENPDAGDAIDELSRTPGGSGAADTGVFTVSYSCDEPDALKIDGPDTVNEGESLYFYVTVACDYAISEVSANGSVLEPLSVSPFEDDNEAVYTYKIDDVSEDTVIFLDATQVLKGSGSVEVFEVNSENSEAEYTLTVTDAPTNTPISLKSTTITVKDSYGNTVSVNLEGNLYYSTDAATEIANAVPVSYLMLDGNIEAEGSTPEEPVYKEDEFVLTAYDEDGNALSGGILVLDIIGSDKIAIWNVQTNTLCYLDEDNGGAYTQKIVGVSKAFEPIYYYVGDLEEGATMDLDALTESSGNKFYYGTAEGTSVNLTQCYNVEKVNGRALPVNPATDETVEDYGELFMAYDELYSFDVEVNDVVNEHTEDNGDTYLWFGNTFYIDQYHSQGVYQGGYTECGGSSGIDDIAGSYGVWPMLGRTRETLINNGTYGFDHWIDQGESLHGWENTKVYDGVEGNDTTKNGSGKDTDDKYYGIVGPFSFENGETEPETTIVRVTGRVGDEFVAADALGTDIVYMITGESDYHGEWYNLGSHASDGGQRSWFYWINDFYIVNNYEDELEYIEIVERNGEVRLEADEIGSSGKGEEYDIWGTYLCTKRDSAVKTFMMENQGYLEGLNVGFNKYAGWPMHVQLRMTNTVETIISGTIYSGQLELVSSSGYVPHVDYKIYGTNDDDGTEEWYEGSVDLTMQNSQETHPENLDFHVNPEYATNDEYVQITVTVYATGTLTAADGVSPDIVYDSSNMLRYSYTLTSEQLREAIDCCPNKMGYDVALNLSEAVRVANGKQIILYKVWQDGNDWMGARSSVNHVTVSLKRSKGGDSENRDDWEWEDVMDESGEQKAAFTIWGDESENMWSLILTSDDLDLTWTDEYGEEHDYYFKIFYEQDIDGVKDGYGYGVQYTYETDDTALFIVNTLNEYPISVSGTKVWEDVDGNRLVAPDERLPESVTIAIFQNDKFYSMVEVTDKNEWSFTFTDLPQELIIGSDDNGETTYELKNIYTLRELSADGTPVESGGMVLLDKGYYLVTIKEQTDSAGEGTGADDSPDEEGSTSYTITNTYVTTELPNTGGGGTMPYAAAGLLIMAGAAALLCRKHKNQGKYLR